MDFATFGIVIVLALAIPVYGLMPVRSRQKCRKGACQKCGYSREGLGGANCPECGSPPCSPVAQTDEAPTQQQQGLQWLALCFAALCAGSLQWGFLRVVYAFDYMRDGFTFEQGWHACLHREMGRVNGSSEMVFWLMMLGIPLFAREKKIKRCVMCATAWVFVSMLCSLLIAR